MITDGIPGLYGAHSVNLRDTHSADYERKPKGELGEHRNSTDTKAGQEPSPRPWSCEVTVPPRAT